MKKTASYHSLVNSLEGFLGKDGSSVKAAEEQGSTESPAPDVPGTDPEVKDILPDGSHERGSTPMNDITGKPGVPSGTPVPGQPTPPTEEPKKEETSPESKVASLSTEKVTQGHDKFAAILAELRGEEIAEPATRKTASEAATPSDAKSDPEIADLSGNGNGGTPPKNDEDTSGNPKSESGAGSNNEPGCSMKEAGLSDDDIMSLTTKVARFIEDQQYASAMAGQLIQNTFGVQVTGQKTAAVAPKPTKQQKLAYAELETRVNAKVAELVAQGLNRDQIAWQIQKIAMDEGAALVSGPAPEEAAPMPEGGGEQQVSPEEIVVVLEQLVQAGEISPEEAVQAAQVIDEQLNGGGSMPPPEGGGLPPEGPPAPPSEGGGEGPPAPPSEGGGEEEEEDDDDDDDDDEEEEEAEPSDKKEAALKKANYEYNRGLKIASLINQKIAENRGGQKVATKKVPKGTSKLRNTKIALLKGQNATEASISAFMTSMENQKRAGVKVSQSNNPSIQDAFLAIDTLVDRGYITAKKAADALETLQTKGDVTKVAAIIKTAQALETIKKIAGAEPMPPEAGAGAPPPAGPPAGPEGGAPAGDPTAAIDQLLGALEQLVMAGVIPEDKAVEMVQSLGIAPPPGPEGAGAGAPPMPPGGPAAPVPGGEAPSGPPMV